MSVVYRITSPSGKQYIGVSKYTADWRFKCHVNHARSGRKTALCAAINKYGPDAMKVETLLVADSDYCFEIEKKAIKAFGTLHPNGYNLTTGGEGVHEMAPASKEKHSAAMRSEEIRALKSANSKLHRNKPESKKKTSEQMKQRWQSPEWRDHFLLQMQKRREENPNIWRKAKDTQKTCTVCGSFYMGAKNVFSLYCSASCKTKAYRVRESTPRKEDRI